MTKAEIITRIYEKIGFSKKDATDVVEATFDIIKGCLEQGRKGQDLRLRQLRREYQAAAQRTKPSNRR